MKLVFADVFVVDDVVVDFGLLVAEAGTLEVLGYMGVTADRNEIPAMTTTRHPLVWQTAEAIPGESIEEMTQGALEFIDRYLDVEDGEGFSLVVRGPNVPWKMEDLAMAADSVLPIESLDDTLMILGIPSMYLHDAQTWEDLCEVRAVNRAAFLHGETLVYGNNIRAWGIEAIENGAAVPTDPNQESLFG